MEAREGSGRIIHNNQPATMNTTKLDVRLNAALYNFLWNTGFLSPQFWRKVICNIKFRSKNQNMFLVEGRRNSWKGCTRLDFPWFLWKLLAQLVKLLCFYVRLFVLSFCFVSFRFKSKKGKKKCGGDWTRVLAEEETQGRTGHVPAPSPLGYCTTFEKWILDVGKTHLPAQKELQAKYIFWILNTTSP
jgi:hypothetical protein